MGHCTMYARESAVIWGVFGSEPHPDLASHLSSATCEGTLVEVHGFAMLQ